MTGSAFWLSGFDQWVRSRNTNKNNPTEKIFFELYELFIKNYFYVKIDKCNKKFTFLNTAWPGLNKYYSNKDLLTSLIDTNKSCHYDYSILNDDRLNYEPFWLNPFKNEHDNNFTSARNISSAFLFTKTKYLKDNSYVGSFATYLSGGYAYKIICDNIQTEKDNLISLQKMNWIDLRTRAVFFDFTLYNPNVNLFAHCSFVFEILSSGGIIPTANVITMNLWSPTREVIVTACFVTYIIVIVVLMAKEISSIKELKHKYFHEFWIYVDWTLFAFSLTSALIYIYKLYALHDLLNFISENQISNINLSTLIGWNSSLSILLAFCTFIATIKLIRLLRFDKKLSYLTDAFKDCFRKLITFLIVYLIFSLAFCQLMFIIYNDKTLGYATFVKSIKSNFQIILGKFNLNPIVESNFTLGAIIFSTYTILIVFILTNVIITIISESFTKSRNEAKKNKEISLAAHLIKRIGDYLPKQRNQMKPEDYVPPSGVENTQTFEIEVTKLVNSLKSRIEVRKKIEFD